MTRVALEDLGNKEVERIYIAVELGEAKRVEKTLMENGVNYAVEVEPYSRLGFVSFFMSSDYKGAAFYVLSGQAEFCRRALREAGLRAGILEEPFS